jgi:protein TonB
MPVKVIGTITFNFTMAGEPSRPDGAAHSPGEGDPHGSGVGGARIEPSSDAATNVDSRPVALNSPRPNYTNVARANHTEGTVVLRALVGSDGLIKRIVVAKGLPDGLNEEAIRAAEQLRFKPAIKGGQPVAFWLALEIAFVFGK